MASVLVDTSVWIEFFRRGGHPAAALLDRLLEEDRAALCGIVELELLQGAKREEREELKELLGAMPFIETDREDFQSAGNLLASMRAKGAQVPATDGLIAALCLRHQVPLLTLDGHFDRFPTLKKEKF